MSKLKLALAFLSGILSLVVIAYLGWFYWVNLDESATVALPGLDLLAAEDGGEAAGVFTLTSGALALVGAAAGALAAAVVALLMVLRHGLSTRILRAEIASLREELHAFRTLPLEAPSYLTADSRGRPRPLPGRPAPAAEAPADSAAPAA